MEKKFLRHICLEFKAFSLIELLVALIILSLISSAFIPLVTKKLKASDITVGSFNNNEGELITCKDGYHELNNKCVLDIENCLSYDNLNKCIVCKAGYLLQDYVCYKMIDNCKIQVANTCSTCNTGYTLSNNACYSSISNCKTQTINTCSACNTGYVLSNNTCYAAIANCKTQTGDTCSACNTGYNLTSSGTCTLACNCPNGTCLSNSNTTCSSCNSGYVLLNNTCLACEPSNGFVKVGDNLCVMQYNIGDGKYGESWDGIQKCIAGNSCTVANRTGANTTTSNLTPTCWQGKTAVATTCNDNYGNYSGCNRTACNWTGGNQMCNNIGWRLPNLAELQSFANTTYSSNTLAENGLMFCDSGNANAPRCAYLTNCTGSEDNACYIRSVWSSTFPSTTYQGWRRCLENGAWNDKTYHLNYAFSVRCVKDL